jgi:predicted negative regulator of RcsB-dependent stress response
MNPDTEHKQHHNPLHDHELEREEVHEVLVFLRKNGMSIAIAIAIGVLAALGGILYRNSQTQKKMYAAKALASAQSLEALQAVQNDFAGTPAAKVAQLELAAEQFASGEYAEARATYQAFIDENPGNDIAQALPVCVALCHEALGEQEQALAASRAFLAKNPDHFMAPAAVFLQARALSDEGEFDEARALYEEFIADNQDSLWKEQAQSALRELNRLIRADVASR